MHVERKFSHNRTPSIQNAVLNIPQYPTHDSELRASSELPRDLTVLQQLKRAMGLRLPPKLRKPTTVKKTLYDVLQKGKKPRLDEIKPYEMEFRTYLRPVIAHEDEGWSFVFNNLT